MVKTPTPNPDPLNPDPPNLTPNQGDASAPKYADQPLCAQCKNEPDCGVLRVFRSVNPRDSIIQGTPDNPGCGQFSLKPADPAKE